MKNNKKGCEILRIITVIVSLIIAVRDYNQGEKTNAVLWVIIAGIWLFVFIRDIKRDVSK